MSNGNVGVAQSSPQTPHPFRIAPVSTGLINAARRVRDPRLRRNEQQHQVSPASSNSAGTAVNREAKSPALCQVESKNDKRNGLYIILFRVNFNHKCYQCKKFIVLFKYKILSSVS